MRRLAAAVGLVVLVLLLIGCPRKGRRTLVPEVPTSGDAGARSRFLDARARFERDGTGGPEFAAIARDFPDDPVAPYANLYAGIAAVKAGDHKVAIPSLEAAVEDTREAGLVTRAELYLGMARNYTGDHGGALPLLARSEKAIENDDERGEWTAAMAVATAASTTPLDALRWYDRWWPQALPAERAFIIEKLGALASGAPPADVRAAFDGLERRDGPAAAIVGWRVATDLDVGGDAAAAASVRGMIAGARRNLGLPVGDTEVAAGDGRGGDPSRVGAVLPLTGKQSRVAEAALKGLTAVTGALGGASGGATTPAALNIEIRDATGAASSGGAVDELAAGGVIAVVGPIDGESVDGAAARAAAAGVPLLSLNPRADERPAAALVFHMMHSAEQRGRILARRAHALGVRRFAILAPESGYGRAVGKAFRDEVGRLGDQVVTEVGYPADTKSFTAVVKKLDGSWQALFVPEQADRLELIAPALAVAGMVSRPFKGKAPKGSHAIVLLSTAEGAGPDYVRDAGRHSLGALLAPGFFPLTDREGDPAIAGFVDDYQRAFGRPPTAVEAYAHDAARLVAALVAGGARTRAALARKLGDAAVVGVTGTVRFDRDHRRADDGVVFTLESDGVGGVQVKTLRE